MFDPLHFSLQPCCMRTMPRTRRGSAEDRQRRRYPRFFLDFDWFVTSDGCSAMGRGLEISTRGARLPVTATSPFTPEVTLFVSMPARARMFQVRCAAVQRPGRGWLLSFLEVAPEDLQLLGTTLIGAYGLLAFPSQHHWDDESETAR